MHHHETRVVPYTADQMFDLVADVARYPEFLPWVTAARIRTREAEAFVADVLVGFKSFREKFTSRVVLNRAKRVIIAEYLDGPFKHLTNRWHFEPKQDGGCTIDFDIDFEFKLRVLERLIGTLFDRAVMKMTDAFEARAAQLYGAAEAVTAPSGAAG
ncbi:MAG: type II toxin-antitoxin system RatA family toxin [Alphaproteobacteria bacterium]|nr:type II toxin-antitoxin system RatA family toxin [Alphaproteobacteria bacterium]